MNEENQFHFYDKKGIKIIDNLKNENYIIEIK